MKKYSQKGFAHLGLALLLLVVVVIAAIGYRVAKDHNKTVSNTKGPATVQEIQTIKSTTDLNAAQSTLDSASVDSDLNPDQLNDDVNGLL